MGRCRDRSEIVQMAQHRGQSANLPGRNEGGQDYFQDIVVLTHPLSPTQAGIGSIIIRWEPAAEKCKMHTGIGMMCGVDITNKHPQMKSREVEGVC